MRANQVRQHAGAESKPLAEEREESWKKGAPSSASQKIQDGHWRPSVPRMQAASSSTGEYEKMKEWHTLGTPVPKS